jgi:hypothetical protein
MGSGPQPGGASHGKRCGFCHVVVSLVSHHVRYAAHVKCAYVRYRLLAFLR